MLFVDSGVWIDLLNGASTPTVDYLVRAIPRERVAIGDLVLMEILQGCRDDRSFAETRRTLSAFYPVQIVGPIVAVQAASNYRALRARGITVRKTIDTLIATRCIVEGWPLLYSDRDFDPFVEHLGLLSALS